MNDLIFCKFTFQKNGRVVLYIQRLFIGFFCVCIFGCSTTPDKLKTAEQLIETSPDSSLHILEKLQLKEISGSFNKALYALLMIKALDKTEIKIDNDSLISFATDYFEDSHPIYAGYAWFYRARIASNLGNLNEQAKYLLKAQEYSEKTNDRKLRGLIYGEKGQLFRNQVQLDSSIYYSKIAQNAFAMINDNKNTSICFINIGYDFLNLAKNDSALKYFFLAEIIAKKLLNDTILISTIYRSLGSVYSKQKDYYQALIYYNKVPLTSSEIYDSNKWLLQANLYVRLGKTDSARYCLNRVKLLYEMAPNYYKIWQQVYEKEGNIKQALTISTKAINAVDSLYKSKLDISFAGLEKKYMYQSLLITNQQLIIKKKKNGVVLLIVLLILSTLAVFVLFWRVRVKRQQLVSQRIMAIQDHAIIEKEKEKLEKEIENSSLIAKQLKLQNILLLNIEKHRKSTIKQPGIWKTTGELLPEQNTTFYHEIIAFIDLEYNDVSIRLLNKFSSLTKRDIFVCCLLLANFESGMIATILDVKIDSVIKHRYRLRTKLNLQNSDNLINYLRQF